MVFDDATRRRMSSLLERLPIHLKKLEAASVESLEAAAAISLGNVHAN